MSDTIVACSTPQGKGGIGVVRMSGANAGHIVAKVLKHKENDPKNSPRKLCHNWIVDRSGAKLDEVLVVYFPAPHTYTGENMVEVHCHGGQAVVDAIIEELFVAGARPASRGEFTRRSFEAGKMDLCKAESVLKIIEASTRDEVRGAARALDGEFGEYIRTIKTEMMNSLVWMEASIDFPEDIACEGNMSTKSDETFKSIQSILSQTDKLQRSIKKDIKTYHEIVLAGKPNVGKSSIMNVVAGRRVSIVTKEPGTTRDAIRADLLMGGMRVAMVDTAGIVDNDFSSEAEREADRVAREKIENACLLIWVTDSPDEDLCWKPDNDKRKPGSVMWVINKSDLINPDRVGKLSKELKKKSALLLSAKTGQGLEELENKIVEKLLEEYGPPDGIPVTTRQERALEKIKNNLSEAGRRIQANQLELATEEMRAAIQAAAGILGEELEAEEIMDKIFEQFCIGK